MCDAFWAFGAKRRSKRIACWRSATDHSCPAGPIYRGFGEMITIRSVPFLLKKSAGPSKTKEFLLKKWTKDTKRKHLQVYG